MSPRYLILLCSFVIVNCKTFYANQHLPLSNPYQPQAFVPYYTQPKTGYQNEPIYSGDYSDLMRQYQQFQIAIPNQQQGGVVWISAPIYGQTPPGAPGYPPAPPPHSPSPANPGPTDSTNQHTVMRDTVVTPGTPEENTDGNVTLSPIENPPSSTYSTSSTTYSSPETTKPTEHTSTSTTIKYTESTKPPPNENSTQPSINSTNPLLKYCKEPRGQFADPSDCHKFINCWDETAVEQSCPSGLVFNPEKHYCDYPEHVNCTSSPGNTTHPSPPANPPSDGNSTNPKCPSTYGTYRNTSDCAAFYVCVNGEPVDFICPPGTAYSDELKVCDYPYRVDCKGAPYKPAPTEEPPKEEWSTSSSSSTYSTSSEEPSTTTTKEPSSTSPSTEATSTTSAPAWGTESSPPSVDPIALYNLNLKKLPESIVNTGVRCYHQNMFRLTPDCSSVTICQDGQTYIVNCGQSTSFDAFSQRCVPTFRARC